MINCKGCGLKKEDNSHINRNFCDNCTPNKNPRLGVPGTVEKVFLTDYGYTEKSRIKEMERRVVLNLKEDGSYDVGRRSDSGKVEEREPNY